MARTRERLALEAIKAVTATTKDGASGLSRIMTIARQAGVDAPYGDLLRDPDIALIALAPRPVWQHLFEAAPAEKITAAEARRLAILFEAARLGWVNLEAAGGGIVGGKPVTERDAQVAASLLDWVIASMLPLLAMGGGEA